MAVDKLVDSTQLDTDLTSVANAIRTKGGTSAILAFPAGFVSAIAAIPTGGGSSVISGTFTPSENAYGHTFEIGSSWSYFVFYAASNPYGTGVRTVGAGIVEKNGIHVGVGSNTSGSSASAGYNSSNYCSTTDTTVTIIGNSSNGNFIAGITYNWFAW